MPGNWIAKEASQWGFRIWINNNFSYLIIIYNAANTNKHRINNLTWAVENLLYV